MVCLSPASLMSRALHQCSRLNELLIKGLLCEGLDAQCTHGLA